MTAGCDDPLVEYLAVRLDQDDLGATATASRLVWAADKLQQSAYPRTDGATP
jgi:hypothetical protein